MILFSSNQKVMDCKWKTINDVVMGGKSIGIIEFNHDSQVVFKGKVSLENNGGFSSAKCEFSETNIEGATKVVLRVKGDGKNYQFRIKVNSLDNHSYIAKFSTSGKWEDIEINLNTMFPSFRGRKLDLPNLSEKLIREIAFLIANKSEEYFELVIDGIEFK
ncbi:MAG: CIA30 family protein [Flavobacteriales bacterium]|nr:CIA30 family protein [Flavobacteriales bacterium]